MGAASGLIQQSSRVLLAATGLFLAAAIDTPVPVDFAPEASAQPSIQDMTGEVGSENEAGTRFIAIANSIINWVYVIAGFVAVVSLIFAAFNMGKDKDLAPVWWTLGSVAVIAIAATLVKMVMAIPAGVRA